MDWQALFLSPNGRISRQTFWIGFGIVFAASIIVNMIPFLGQLLGLALIWPQICIHTKRLHDMGHSGWLMLIPAGVSLGAGAYAAATGGAALLNQGSYQTAGAALGAVALAFAVAFLAGLGFLLWVGITPGQPGDNRYGVSPIPAELMD